MSTIVVVQFYKHNTTWHGLTWHRMTKYNVTLSIVGLLFCKITFVIIIIKLNLKNVTKYFLCTISTESNNLKQ